MSGPSEDVNSAALDSFREEWKAEVRAKQSQTRAQPVKETRPQTQKPLPKNHKRGQSSTQRFHPARIPPLSDVVSTPPASAADLAPALASVPAVPAAAAPAPPAQSPSAVDLYEQAVELESRGNLGDSLRLYRTAFRMDAKVEQQYKAKHFPPTGAANKPALSQTSPASAPPAASRSSDAAQPSRTHAQSTEDLISSFAGLSIEPAPPAVEGMPPPPCPISSLPDEVLLHILTDVAVDDVGDFVRLSRVCKRLAYLVATEQQIWRRVCLGSEFGFSGMHRRWNTGLTWEKIEPNFPSGDTLEYSTGAEVDQPQSHDEGALAPDQEHLVALSLLRSTYKSSWQNMFRSRPRIRFNGCYISTVNYIRTGQASANQVTWNSPVHICTYFRYLRFFRDGTCISLLTTTEPADVVQHLSKETLELHRNGAMAHLPSIVMQNALKGRWRLGSTATESDNEGEAMASAAGAAEAPGPGGSPGSEDDVFVETEGIGKYMYRMELALKTAGKAARNNKLAWKSFYSYNRLTDDWAEFTLKNDRPFVFSRVKRFA